MTLSNTISEVKDSIQGGASIMSLKVGYLHELNTGLTTFDFALIQPPKMVKTEPINDGLKTYEVTWYILRHEKGSGGGRMTEAERITAWSDMETKNSAIINSLIGKTTKLHVVRGYEVEMDSTEGGALLTVPVIWVRCKCYIETDHCSGS